MKIGFIGAGKMAEAMVASFIAGGAVAKGDVMVSDISLDRRRHMKQVGVRVTEHNDEVAASSDVLFLAVKPQDLGPVLATVAGVLRPRTLVVSIAAGKKTAFLERHLRGARVVRVMPNLPCTVGEAMSAFCLGRQAKPADQRTAQRLLSCCGKVLQLPEKHFDAVTALSGSGPAFLTYFLNQMVQAAVVEGLKKSDALLLAEQTMYGTAKYLMDTQADPESFIQAVASAKGTTAAGLAVLDRSPAGRLIRTMVAAAAERSRELSRMD
jgi:pyrroline-5-carboxylate reductase